MNLHEDEGSTMCIRFEKRNLISISALDKKGYKVSFVDGQVLTWTKGNTLEDDLVIGEDKGVLYKLKGHPKITLIHDTTILSELWHRRLTHINYKSLPYVRKMVTSL